MAPERWKRRGLGACRSGAADVYGLGALAYEMLAGRPPFVAPTRAALRLAILNDYDVIFSKLAAVGFRGWVSIEDGDNPDVGMEHLRLSAEFLRAKMKQHGLP